jgi:HK97 family phage portal protein
MGLITNLLEKRGRTMDSDYASGQWPSLAGYMTHVSKSGVAMDEKLSMNLIIVYACVRLLSETVASLPWFVYRRKKDGKEKAPEHALYKLLHDAPNPSMSSFNYRQKMMVDLLLWGNHFSQVKRDPSTYQVLELWPLESGSVEVKGNVREQSYVYRPIGGTEQIFNSSEIFHISGLSFDGIRGYPPLTIMREAVGLGMALEEFGSTFFRNGTNIGGIAQHPKALGEKARKYLEESLGKKTGVGNSNSLLILEEGMTYQKIGIPPEDAQFLQTRQFQTTEIARFFNVPPHMVGDLTRSTNNNIEEQAIEFVTYTLRPWLVRIEQEIQRTLVIEKEKQKVFTEFLVDGLLRGNTVQRTTSLQIRRQNGVINADEWREIENLNPIPDGTGKKYLVNSAMKEVDDLGESETGGDESATGTKDPDDTGTGDPQDA